jgi:hypothetical protein
MQGMLPENYRPRARRKGLLQSQLGDELVILDTERNRGMALNPTLARLFHLCDGSRTVARISDALTQQLGRETDSAAVWSGLHRLEKARLLEGDRKLLLKRRSIRSRRQALKAIGLGAGALAVVMLPTPADAATCMPNTSLCTSDAQCCSGRCCHSNNHCGTQGPGC